MASDPELQRFAASIARLHEAGQSNICLPERAVDNFVPWQHHLTTVLHFVCEVRGAPVFLRKADTWTLRFAQMKNRVSITGYLIRSGIMPIAYQVFIFRGRNVSGQRFARNAIHDAAIVNAQRNMVVAADLRPVPAVGYLTYPQPVREADDRRRATRHNRCTWHTNQCTSYIVRQGPRNE